MGADNFVSTMENTLMGIEFFCILMSNPLPLWRRFAVYAYWNNKKKATVFRAKKVIKASFHLLDNTSARKSYRSPHKYQSFETMPEVYGQWWRTSTALFCDIPLFDSMARKVTQFQWAILAYPDAFLEQGSSWITTATALTSSAFQVWANTSAWMLNSSQIRVFVGITPTASLRMEWW